MIAFFEIQKMKDPYMTFAEFKTRISVIMRIKDEDLLMIFKHLDKLNSKRVSCITFLQFARFDLEYISNEIDVKLIQGISVREYMKH